MVWSQSKAAIRKWVLTFGSRLGSAFRFVLRKHDRDPNVSTHIRIAGVLWDQTNENMHLHAMRRNWPLKLRERGRYNRNMEIDAWFSFHWKSPGFTIYTLPLKTWRKKSVLHQKWVNSILGCWSVWYVRLRKQIFKWIEFENVSLEWALMST